MFEFLENAEPLLQGFWYVALFASLIFLIQSVLTIVGGMDSGDFGMDVEFDTDGDTSGMPFQFFSFRNLINFLLGFGWTGVVFFDSISNKYLLIALASLVGGLFVFLFFLLIKQIMKLSEDNTYSLEKFKNMTGQVYIPIPEDMSGVGRIQISLSGTSHELNAMTEDSERLTSGTMVEVENFKDNILIVKKIK